MGQTHQALQNLIEKGTEYNLEYEISPADGGPNKFIHSVAELVRDEAGTLSKVVGIIQDITERRDFDRRVHRLNRELVAIKECNRALVKGNTEQELLDDICRIVCDEADYRMAWIGMAEHDEARSVTPVAWSGFDQIYITRVKASWGENERGNGPVGMSIKTGRTIFIQDLANDKRMDPWRELARRNGYRSAIALPLLDSGVAFGAFMLYSDQIDGFTVDELDLLEEMAGDLAFGIMSIRERKERQDAQEAQKTSDVRFRTLFESNNDAILIIEQENGHIIDVNRSVTRLYGYSREELIGLDIRTMTMEPERTWQILNSERSFIPIQFHRRKDGKTFPAEITINKLLITGRRTTVVTVRDISERLRAENDLRESEKRFQNLADNTFEGISISSNGKVIDTNRTLSDLLGYRREELIGKDLFDLLTPESVKSVRDQRKLEGPGPLEAEMINRNGDVLSVQIREKNIIWKGRPAKFVAVMDVTDLKKAERCSQESEMRYHGLFDSTIEGIAVHEIIQDENGVPSDYRFLDINPAFERMTGLERSATIGRTVREVIPDIEATWIERYGRVSLTGTPEHFEDRAEALGKTFEVFAYRNGRLQFTTNFNDVTERKRTELALHEGENLRHAILDSVGIGMAYWGAEGKLILMNSIAAAHLRGIPEDFIGLNIKEIFGDVVGQTYLERINLSRGSVRPTEYEDSVELPGRTAWFLSIYTKVMGSNDGGGVLILSHEITARKNMEETLRKSEEHYSKLALNHILNSKVI
jgi:PAS domain S-box-containing protein